MSLYTSLREEILEKIALSEEAIKAEISGFLSAKAEPSFKIKLDSPSETRKLCKYLDIIGEKYSLKAKYKNGYEILLRKFPEFAKDPLAYLNDSLWGDFMRGLFWGCGSMVKPWKGYHLEIGIPQRDLALYIERFLREKGLSVSLRIRNNRYYIMFRNMSSVGSVLKTIGAERFLKKLEDVRTVKRIREKANREANCDAANAERIASASLKDRILIDQLGDRINKLPAKLREIAELRIKHPSLSLKEIGALMDPPLSKMSVYRALRKIRKILEIRKEGENFVFWKIENKQL
ncbi:MAG: DNA-binding protein WhiA [Synergistetes bacterium]|nr:DNA-binding protein WhiA [Synergistota bacterium]MCX8128205.1 DNA-binding protein WhiA [Synergistota bacterium]MDW8192652.1 DNA-binding protein WhiA [Synergistota bacterium]